MPPNFLSAPEVNSIRQHHNRLVSIDGPEKKILICYYLVVKHGIVATVLDMKNLNTGNVVHQNTILNAKFIVSVLYVLIQWVFQGQINYSAIKDEFSDLLFTEAQLSGFFERNKPWV